MRTSRFRSGLHGAIGSVNAWSTDASRQVVRSKSSPTSDSMRCHDNVGSFRNGGIVGDPLFVKSGRGIVPTLHTKLLAARAHVMLDELRSFSHPADFDPATLETTVTIAANDLQRDLLLPTLLRHVRAQARGFALRAIRSGAPSAEMLRDEHCQLVITPRPPDGADVLQKRLFEDHYRIFDAARQRDPPRRREIEFLRVPIGRVFVPMTHDLLRAATINTAGHVAHVCHEVTKERGAWPKSLLIDLAFQGLRQSENELRHAAYLCSRVFRIA